MVCWGDKYSTALINHLMNSIEAHAASPVRFVLICDTPKIGLRADALIRNFPEFYLQPIMKRSGCQAKLAMFEAGVVPTDLPAVYVDLDTVVMGDLGAGLRLMDSPQTVAILPSAVIPFGWLGRLIYRLSGQKKYARGNSSIVIFHPAHCAFIAERFRTLFAQYPNFEFRPMVADERFISWVAQPFMKALPKSFVVKFPGEFMFYFRPWLYAKAKLPWVIKRRANLVAITLNGLLIKPESLVRLKENEVVVDNKNRQLVWTRKTLGKSLDDILYFYRFLS